MFIARQRDTDPSKRPQFSFDKEDRRVTVYYFYLWDADFGPAFIKVCTYCPWPIKMWVNGHEWAKRQAARAGLGVHRTVQRIRRHRRSQLRCKRSATGSGPGTIDVFFQRWLSPAAAAADRSRPRTRATGGSCRCAQIEISRTLVFDAAALRPRLLRGAGRRQPRSRPPGHRRDRSSTGQIRGGQRATAGASVEDRRSSLAAPRSRSTPSTSTPASSST